MKTKLIATMLGLVLLMGAGTPVWASEKVQEVLTLEKAIKKAKEISRELPSLQRKEKYLAEKEGNALNMGSYGDFIRYNTDRQYTQKKETLENEQIKIRISKLFDEILVLEKEIDLSKRNIHLKEQELQRDKLKYQKEIIKESEIEELQLAYEKLLIDKKKLEDNLESRYNQLSKYIGVRSNQYVLQKDENIYKPYEYIGNAESIGERRSKEHLAVWQAEKQQKVTESSFEGGSYEAYLDYKNNKEEAANNARTVEENTKKQISNLFIEVRQLEAQYETLSKELELKEKEAKRSEIYLKKGTISKVEYEKKVLEYEEAQLGLRKLINNHTYLKKQLNNPNLTD